MMYVSKASEAPREPISAAKGTFRQVLIGAEQAPHFAMRLFTIEPGGSMPEHTNTVEHEQYVIAGKARISIDGKEFIVEKDNVVFIPEGVPHWYENIGEEDFRFLCMVPKKVDRIQLTG